MPSSLHVSLPDEMRDFVDHRSNGTRQFSTPSEYVRALIRADMEREQERDYVIKELLKSKADIEAGRTYPASILKTIRNDVFAKLRAEAGSADMQ